MIKVLLLGIFIGATIGYITAALMRTKDQLVLLYHQSTSMDP